MQRLAAERAAICSSTVPYISLRSLSISPRLLLRASSTCASADVSVSHYAMRCAMRYVMHHMMHHVMHHVMHHLMHHVMHLRLGRPKLVARELSRRRRQRRLPSHHRLLEQILHRHVIPIVLLPRHVTRRRRATRRPATRRLARRRARRSASTLVHTTGAATARVVQQGRKTPLTLSPLRVRTLGARKLVACGRHHAAASHGAARRRDLDTAPGPQVQRLDRAPQVFGRVALLKRWRGEVEVFGATVRAVSAVLVRDLEGSLPP